MAGAVTPLWHIGPMDGQGEDRGRVADARRVVIKLGTNVVTRGDRFALSRVAAAVEVISDMRLDGREPLLVSSGAIGLGARHLGLPRPTSLGLKQACAAVGQGRLMSLYTELFDKQGITAAQVLLADEDLGDPDRALCLRTTLLRLIELGTVPVLNENDSVSVREIRDVHRGRSGPDGGPRAGFGDNDGLSARIAIALDADLLVIMSDVDGLLTANPAEDPDATLIPRVEAIDDQVIARARGRSSGGTGGMASKLEAARLATEAGVDVLIINGDAPENLRRALRGEDVGTWFTTQTRRNERRRRIALRPDVVGAMVVNDGAAAALRHEKASLLPVGVVDVQGDFGEGTLVEIRDSAGRVLGRGLTNYDSVASRTIMGHHSDAIAGLLGWKGYDALITRDNLVMGDI